MARFKCFVQLFVSIDWLSSILASDLWTADHEFAFVHIYFTKFLKIIIFLFKMSYLSPTLLRTMLSIIIKLSADLRNYFRV